MKNKLLEGSLILIVASLVCKVLGAVYRIPLSNILGAEGIGVYQMIFSVFSLALIVSSGGVSVTVSHQVAKVLASGQGSTKAIFLRGFIYSLVSSLVFAVLFLLMGEKIAAFQGNSLGTSGYAAMAICLVFASLIAPFRGLFQGHQNMLPTAISQMIEQIFKLVLGLAFASYFIKYGLSQGVMGAFLGIVISEFLALLFLAINSKKTRVFKVYPTPLKQSFWKTNSVITLSILVVPLITAIDSFLVVNLLSTYLDRSYATALYGLQSGIVSSLINFPVVISISISLALLPNLSYLLSSSLHLEAKKSLKNVYTALISIVLPFSIAFFVFAKDIFSLLYPTLDENLLNMAVILLRVSTLEVFFLALLHVSISALQSLDKAAIGVYVLTITGIIKTVLMAIMVNNPEINILGAAWSSVLFYVISAAITYFIVKKNVAFSLDKKQVAFCLTLNILLALVFLGVNVYFENILAKICFSGLGVLLVYVLPLYLNNFLNIKAFASNIFRRTKIE